ncbi:hypothetical protein R1T43_12500 [Alteromonas sp. CI.11.F.A3]|uniref:hypothetical protein n=1 Tax=Alteromonas sp. CI.11.F.A3 TaxID=3079555 RepID=UPI002943B670|nr:hypothetical protein [Alteromonas sp. CI.11.F.A3]WOI36042.1 hypothetical protein R1T43_12500 [Alteromonas sp. CI.11.F.A3]
MKDSCIFRKATLIALTIFIASCSSNNASQMKNLSSLGSNTQFKYANEKLPHKELQVIFQLTKDNIDVVDISAKKISRLALIKLLKQNEGKEIANGDTFIDCLVLTDTNRSKPCFSDANKNIPENSVFHDSEVSGGMVLMTVLVPYIVVGAASDGDFYVNNKIDNELLNRVGATIKSDIFTTKKEIHDALTNNAVTTFTKNVKPYMSLINHDVLIQAINNAQSMDKLESIKRVLSEDNYYGFVVKSPIVNQRNRPSTRGKIINKHKKGTLIISEKIEDGWVYNGEGWIYKKILLSRLADAQKAISYRENNLRLNQRYAGLVSGSSVKSINKVLNDKQHLAGIPQDKINKLKAKRYALLDEADFKTAKQKNTVAGFDRYLAQHKNGVYRNEAVLAKKAIFVSQASFDGYMNAFALTKKRSFLALAKKVIMNSNESVNVNRRLLDTYFEAQIKHKNSIPPFASLLAKINDVSISDYSEKLLKLSGISNSYRTDNYLESIEYQYILRYFTPQLNVSYHHKYVYMELTYPDINITIKEDANCDFKETKNGVRSRGFLESLVTLNGDDKVSYTYDVFDCKLGRNELASVNGLLHDLPYYADFSASTLSKTWEATETTSSYTYSTATKTTSFSSQLANWKYTVKCSGTTFSGTPPRTYSGIIVNSTHSDAYLAAQKEQSDMDCSDRFGNRYVGEGYLDMEIQ